MDAFDLFSNQTETYSASLWLYNSTEGVVCLGESYASVEAAEQALATYSELKLYWSHDTIDNGIDLLATKAHDDSINVAVVLRVENGDVVSHAGIVDGWFPPGDPRRGSNTPSVA